MQNSQSVVILFNINYTHNDKYNSTGYVQHVFDLIKLIVK